MKSLGKVHKHNFGANGGGPNHGLWAHGPDSLFWSQWLSRNY